MLTPSFDIKQTENDITITIHAPLANVVKTELCAEDETILFYSSPYYLRLHLPGKIVAVEGEHGTYDPDKQDFSFTLKKHSPGEHFEDLDLIGKLLVPNKKHQHKPEISVIDSEENVPSFNTDSDDELFGYIEQEIVENVFSDKGYGFANKGGHELGQSLRYEFSEILDCVQLENWNSSDRSLLRECDEQTKFDEEHYLADFMEREEVNEILEWEPEFRNSDEVTFTEEEKDRLRTLGNRDYLLDKNEKKITLFSLVDILFAYAYDQRANFGEESVETAWTVNKLSATLSWLQAFTSLKDVKIACARRSLIFPIYRNWDLTIKLFEDTANLFKSGRKQVLKCLLHIHKLFNESEPRYLLNQLYITDYCIWIQKVSETSIKRLGESFEKVDITKEEVNLDLDELEQAALIVQEEEQMNVLNRMMNLTINDSFGDVISNEEDSDDEESSCDSCSDEDSSNESSDGDFIPGSDSASSSEYTSTSESLDSDDTDSDE